jgi:hypothetical protein
MAFEIDRHNETSNAEKPMNRYLVVKATEVEATSMTEVVEKYKNPENVAYIDLKMTGGIAQDEFIELMAVSFPALVSEEQGPWPNREQVGERKWSK